MFSKACEHGLKAILYIATQSMDGKRVKIGEVAEHTATPEAFTAKVLGTLTKFNILKSVKGPDGGFEMSEEQIHGYDLPISSKPLMAKLFIGCALGLRECNAKRPCPMHHRFVEIRKELKSMMESSTVYDLATDVIAGESVLKTH